jgi:hypothetical protein
MHTADALCPQWPMRVLVHISCYPTFLCFALSPFGPAFRGAEIRAGVETRGLGDLGAAGPFWGGIAVCLLAELSIVPVSTYLLVM